MNVSRQHKRIYLVGKIRAKYRGKKRDIPRGSLGDYALELYETEVTQGTISEIAPAISGGYADSWQFEKLKDVLINLETKEGEEPLWFREDLSNVILSAVELSDVLYDGNRVHGVIEADLYAVLHEETLPLAVWTPPPPPPKPKVKVKPKRVRLGQRPVMPEDPDDFSFWDVVYYIAWIIPVILGIILCFSILVALYHIASFLVWVVLGVALIFGLQWVFQKLKLFDQKRVYEHREWNSAAMLLRMAFGLTLLISAVVLFYTGHRFLGLCFSVFFFAVLGLLVFRQARTLIEIIVYGPASLLLILTITIFSPQLIPLDAIKSVPEKDPREYSEQFIDEDAVRAASADSLYIRHVRAWQDFEQNNYIEPLEVSLLWAGKSEVYRKHVWSGAMQGKVKGLEDVYEVLYRYDYKHLERVYTMFDSLRVHHKPSYQQFAEIIVSCVQDIPYVLVHSQSCTDARQGSDFVRDYHKRGKPCRENTEFGLLSPVEFTASLMGDCDTRTLLLYTILSHYQYDVVILNSDHYAHSMLGIQLPVSGKAFTHFGRKYYLWETTSSNWRAGQLPPDITNLSYWKVALPSANL